MSDAVNIRTLRKSLGWSQRQLADYLGLDRSSVSRMETGRPPKGPTQRLLKQLHDNPAPAHEAAE